MDIIQALQEELKIGRHQVEAAVKLIDEGNTIPFIARYRKEATGSLDDEVLRRLDERLRYLRNLEEKKAQVIATIQEQGKLTPELEKQIQNAATLVMVEDLYRPYRPKRRTRATIAQEKGLAPLKKLRVPVHEVAMMMSIALRFIPILMEETDKIMKAQMARGADFESGGLVKKAKSLVPLLVPLFISAFRRANDLAMAMEARGYRGGDGRTKMKPLIYQKRDYRAYLLMLAYLVCIVLIGKVSPV